MGRVRDKAKQRQYERAWYARNRAKVRAKVRARRLRIAEWFRSFKETLSCLRCGENDWVALDFHHRDPRKKDPTINEMWRKGWGIKRILAEIAKCDVLCANCHRKWHRDQRERELEELFNSIPINLDPTLPFEEEALQQGG